MMETIETPAPRTPTPGAGILLFLAVLLVQIVTAFLFPRFNVSEDVSILLTPALLLLLTGLAVVMLRVDARQTLLLRLPSRADFFMAFPLAISFFILADQLSLLTQEIFPIPDELLEGALRMMRAESAFEWTFKIATICVGAALSEELMFRGFIQTAFLERLSRSTAILWTAFLFMMLHFLPLPTFAAAGLVLGFAALATRSILVPIAIHFTNNLAALLLTNVAGLDTLGDPLWIPTTIFVPALAIFVLTTGYYLRRIPPPTPRRDEADEAPPRLSLPMNPVSLADELASVPRERRRLGWLVVIAAVVIGMSVLSILFTVSMYTIYPQQTHAKAIELMKAESAGYLSISASERAPRLAAAFDALAAVNRSGTLELRDVAEVFRIFQGVSADGEIDTAEADVLIDRIRDVVVARTRPRRL